MRLGSWRALISGCALLLLAEAAIHSPASARRTQAQLTATFKDRAEVAVAGQKSDRSCTLTFTDLIDERRSPEMAGVVGERGVLAPTDVKLWLKAVLGGFAERGVTPVLSTDAPIETGSPTATFALQTAWISSTEGTYSGNVVIHLTARNSAGTIVDKVYRGRATRTAYWSGGVDTLQSSIDGAFAVALDSMAIDLKKICDG